MTNSSPYTRRFFLTLAIAILLGLAAGLAHGHVKCQSKWARSGLHAEFGVFQGCLVRLPDGRWIPQENVRETDLQLPKQKVHLHT